VAKKEKKKKIDISKRQGFGKTGQRRQIVLTTDDSCMWRGKIITGIRR
jgi:hypothetical protein